MKKEHTSLKDIHLQKKSKTIVDRYCLTIGTVYSRNVLDYGCGCGHGSALMVAYGADYVYGYDKNTQAIAEANFNYKDKINNLKFTNNFDKLPKDFFNFISCFEVIEHIEPNKLKETLKKLHGLMKPGGVMMVTTPIINRYSEENNEGHHTLFTPEGITKFFRELFNEKVIFGSTIEMKLPLFYSTFISKKLEKYSNCYFLIIEK